MMFALVCAGLLISGNADNIVVSGNNFYNYMRVGGGVIHLTATRRGVYDDGGQYQITIARDRKRVWVQLDTDDNPHDRGVELKCHAPRS